MYKPPSTQQEYWEIIDIYWNDIFHILNLYLPTFKNRWIDDTKLDKPLGEFIEDLKRERNPRIARVFNAAYWKIPENISNNEIPSWNKFYDLCVMEYRLYENLEEK